MAAAALSHPAVLYTAGGWCFFVAENAVLSENRAWFIERVGERAYRGCYGLCSTASLASVGYGVWRHGPGPRLRAGVGGLSRVAGVAFQTLGLVGFANLAPPLTNPLAPDATGCPLDFKKARSDRERGDVHGLQRITRHPQFWAMGFCGLGVAAQTPFAGTAAAALGFPLVAALGGFHMDSRHRRGVGGSLTPEREAATSGMPFLALVEGRQSWTALAEDLKPVNSAVAAAASGALAVWVALVT